jgi:hypothetical protein
MTVLVITQWDWDHMTKEFDAGGLPGQATPNQ